MEWTSLLCLAFEPMVRTTLYYLREEILRFTHSVAQWAAPPDLALVMYKPEVELHRIFDQLFYTYPRRVINFLLYVQAVK